MSINRVTAGIPVVASPGVTPSLANKTAEVVLGFTKSGNFQKNAFFGIRKAITIRGYPKAILDGC